MQENSSSSSSSNASCFFNPSLSPYMFMCFGCPTSSRSFISFASTNFLVLPVYILVLWVGLKRWWRQQAATHSDIFTYNIVFVEIIGVAGSTCFFFAVYLCSFGGMIFGFYCFFLTYPTQTLFYCLTCAERYLAVVHPVTYRGLRRSGGVKLRNVSIGCVWLLCVALIGVSARCFPEVPTVLFFAVFAVIVAVNYFCSSAVIRALIRLGLGKVGGDGKRIDQSKQRAFQTVMAITGTLVFRLSGILTACLMFNLRAQITCSECGLLMAATWLCLPSSLALPLLFLHRARALACPGRNPDRLED